MKALEWSDDAKPYVELAAKAALIALFAWSGTHKVLALISLMREWDTIEPVTRWTYLAAHTAALAFISLMVLTTIVRYRPIRSAEGLEPRLSALAGTFLGLSLGLLPPTDLPPAVTLVAVGLSAIGGVLSAYVLFALGRSFSIMPQARKLVTTGPYAIVRHPLYCSEELMALGVVLLFFSPLAVLIALVHWGFQLRRMVNEEKVLSAEFQEYAAYAGRTPRVIPRFARASRPQQET
jgi:protein-S-isoprenylcysteine O-methyltransferase Ste14